MTHLDVGRYNRRPINYRRGDICWINNMEYGDSSHGFKDRPILILGIRGGKVRYRRCTSQPSILRDRREILDLLETGLLKTTYVDMEVLEMPVGRLGKVVGHLSSSDTARLCPV